MFMGKNHFSPEILAVFRIIKMIVNLPLSWLSGNNHRQILCVMH